MNNDEKTAVVCQRDFDIPNLDWSWYPFCETSAIFWFNDLQLTCSLGIHIHEALRLICLRFLFSVNQNLDWNLLNTCLSDDWYRKIPDKMIDRRTRSSSVHSTAKHVSFTPDSVFSTMNWEKIKILISRAQCASKVANDL